jgi:hypothetical protein
MAEQQWEFCELSQGGYREYKGKGDSYSVWIRYYGPSYYKRYELAETEGKNMKIWTVSPFHEAMRLLGANGWELVSHQFASGGDGFQHHIEFYWIQRSAMFKRPVQQGRAVDEPKLVDLIKP